MADKSSRRDILLNAAAAAAGTAAVTSAAMAAAPPAGTMAGPPELKLTPAEAAKDASARRAIADLQKIDPNISFEWTKGVGGVRTIGSRRIIQLNG